VKTIPQKSDELSQYFPHPVFGQNGGGVTFLTLDYATYVLAFFFDFLSYDFNN